MKCPSVLLRGLGARYIICLIHENVNHSIVYNYVSQLPMFAHFSKKLGLEYTVITAKMFPSWTELVLSFENVSE